MMHEASSSTLSFAIPTTVMLLSALSCIVCTRHLERPYQDKYPACCHVMCQQSETSLSTCCSKQARETVASNTTLQQKGTTKNSCIEWMQHQTYCATGCQFDKQNSYRSLLQPSITTTTSKNQRYDFWNLARAPGPPNLHAAHSN